MFSAVFFKKPLVPVKASIFLKSSVPPISVKEYDGLVEAFAHAGTVGSVSVYPVIYPFPSTNVFINFVVGTLPSVAVLGIVVSTPFAPAALS